MIIRGNTVGTTMPRADYAETNPKSAAYIKNKPDEAIQKAQKTADDAVTAAGNAQTAADNAQTAADNAQTAADNAQNTANDALPKAGGTMTGDIVMGGKQITDLADPTENAHAANKGYVDEKRKVFTTTLTVNDWEGDKAPYTQRIGIEGILSTDTPHYGVVFDEDQDTRLAQREAFAMVDDLDTEDGAVIFTCFDDKPDVNIPIQMEVNR